MRASTFSEIASSLSCAYIHTVRLVCFALLTHGARFSAFAGGRVVTSSIVRESTPLVRQ